MRFHDDARVDRKNGSATSLLLARTTLVTLCLYHACFHALHTRTVAMDTTTTNRSINLSVARVGPTFNDRLAHRHDGRLLPFHPFRFASLDAFLSATRSSHDLREIAQHAIPHYNHSKRFRRHRNAGQCSPLLCDEGDDGAGESCPVERHKKQRILNSKGRQCVELVGETNDDSKVNVVIMAANETTQLYDDFCSLRHTYCRPQPEIVPISQLCKMSTNYHYYPYYAILHRCPYHVPCCEVDTRCLPTPGDITNVTLSFYVLQSSGPVTDKMLAWAAVETFTFENHTACNCTNYLSDDEQPVVTDEPPVVSNEHPVMANGSRKDRATSILPSSRRKHVCTRCPKPFICEKIKKRNSCRCRCRENDKVCREIRKGLRPLRKPQQKCVRSQECFEPKCFKKLVYDRKSGKCVQPSPQPDPQLPRQSAEQMSTTTSTVIEELKELDKEEVIGYEHIEINSTEESGEHKESDQIVDNGHADIPILN